jgi:hypothetical protein
LNIPKTGTENHSKMKKWMWRWFQCLKMNVFVCYKYKAVMKMIKLISQINRLTMFIHGHSILSLNTTLKIKIMKLESSNPYFNKLKWFLFKKNRLIKGLVLYFSFQFSKRFSLLISNSFYYQNKAMYTK